MAFGQSVIKSIQRGTISVTDTNQSATVTITSVDTDKSVMNNNGWSTWLQSGAMETRDGYLRLTNSTTITITRYYSQASPNVIYIIMPWEVVEYY
jgi:hypothetical protein